MINCRILLKDLNEDLEASDSSIIREFNNNSVYDIQNSTIVEINKLIKKFLSREYGKDEVQETSFEAKLQNGTEVDIYFPHICPFMIAQISQQLLNQGLKVRVIPYPEVIPEQLTVDELNDFIRRPKCETVPLDTEIPDELELKFNLCNEYIGKTITKELLREMIREEKSKDQAS